MSKFEDLVAQMEANEGTSTPMPLYQSHKKVWALKIKEVVPAPHPTIEELDRILNGDGGVSDLGAIIVPEGHFGPFAVTREFMDKHTPQAGGYYVVYKDGYKSYSPAQAFEEGYTREA
jgi:hypothetical protein